MKRIIALILAMTMLFLCACSKKEKEEAAETAAPETETAAETVASKIENDQPETAPETDEEETEERIEIDGKIRSYLTGEMVDVEIGNRRPIAIMMSNDKQALPQYGMSRAGVIYEAPVEGAMNRYMSVIEDYDDLERIGSVRSCRTYYTYFAKEWDAIYAHYGQSTFAVPYLENVDNINGVESIGSVAYFRSDDRKAPHNAYASAKGLKAAIDKLGYSYEYDPSYEGHFRFSGKGNEVMFDEASSMAADKIVPGYPLNKPYFIYDEKDGLYHRYQYETEHMSDEGPITVKNVIFQYSPTAHYATTEYLNINVHEPTYGYFFTNGRGIPVSVKKDGEFGITRYYDSEGKEIRVNEGKTWICIIRSDCFDDTEIYDKDGSRTDS